MLREPLRALHDGGRARAALVWVAILVLWAAGEDMHTGHRSAPARTPTLGASATVRQIRPLGLACVEDEDGRAWTLTRSTQGVDFDRAAAGQRVRLTIDLYRNAAFVVECRPTS